MKNTTIYKIVGTLIVIVLFLYGLFQVLKNPGSKPNNADQNPAGIPISTPAGEVKVKDFTKTAVESTKDSMLAEKNQGFNIVYFKQDQAFAITLLTEPLAQNRDLAEQAFIKMLNISETDACRLKVSLSIPYDVSAQLSGTDYGLSFCPTGKPF